jgi:hypothetical protein
MLKTTGRRPVVCVWDMGMGFFKLRLRPADMDVMEIRNKFRYRPYSEFVRQLPVGSFIFTKHLGFGLGAGCKPV